MLGKKRVLRARARCCVVGKKRLRVGGGVLMMSVGHQLTSEIATAYPLIIYIFSTFVHIKLPFDRNC